MIIELSEDLSPGMLLIRIECINCNGSGDTRYCSNVVDLQYNPRIDLIGYTLENMLREMSNKGCGSAYFYLGKY